MSVVVDSLEEEEEEEEEEDVKAEEEAESGVEAFVGGAVTGVEGSPSILTIPAPRRPYTWEEKSRDVHTRTQQLGVCPHHTRTTPHSQVCNIN